MRKIALILIFGFLFQLAGKSQTEISRFLTSGADDMEQLTKAYMEPFGKAFGAAMNAGWYNTAKPHKLLGFDVTINGTLVSVPSADGSFDLDTYTWNVLKPDEVNSVTSTISGDGDGAPVGLQVQEGDNSYEINNLYKLPDGIGFNQVPLPMMQLGVGIFKGTDVMFRFFPELEIGDYGKLGMFGFGLRHDFKQWIPVVKKLPFDMSLQGAWSRLGGSYNKIEYYPTDYANISYERINAPTEEAQIISEYYRTQDLTLTSTAWNANFIISKKLAVLTAYASVGYASSTFNIGLNGKYLMPQYIPITSDDYNPAEDSNGDGFVTVLDDNNEITDPIDADIEYSSINTSVGIRIQLALLSIHASYVYQDYSMYNVGLGVSFR